MSDWRSLAANFSVDLVGQPDDRLGTWGLAEAALNEITFSHRPPEKHVVEIGGVFGTLDARIREVLRMEDGGQQVMEVASFEGCGFLFGLLSTAPGGSVQAYPAADNCWLYLQGNVTGEQPSISLPIAHNPLRTVFALERDGKLVIKFAVYLKDFHNPVHLEASFVLEYRFRRTT